MAKLIFEWAIHQDDDGNYESYWPEQWPLALLANEALEQGPIFFAASYQNDPSGLDGNMLKTDWILDNLYLPEELAEARAKNNNQPGTKYAGVDPASGGMESHDSDYCSGMAGELFGQMAFITDFFNKRMPLDEQAPFIESWMDLVKPHFTSVEDIAAKGYVYQALVNKKDPITGEVVRPRWPISIETPQSKMAVGNKTLRYLHVAPRFASGQVRLPGKRLADGSIGLDPKFQAFFDAWRGYPSGHDDPLDAAFWCVVKMFTAPPAIGAHKYANGRVANDEGKTIQEAPEQKSTRLQLIPDPPRKTVGAPIKRRERVGGFGSYGRKMW